MLSKIYNDQTVKAPIFRIDFRFSWGFPLPIAIGQAAKPHCIFCSVSHALGLSRTVHSLEMGSDFWF